MLLIFPKDSDYVPLKILSIEDGTVVKSFNLLLHGNKEVDFIKQYNGKLLVQQENENLRIIDIRSSELTEVNITESVTPSLFTCLFENQLFLTIRNRTVSLWDFRGELITSFEDRLLWVPASTTQTICMTSDESTIISYCKADPELVDPSSKANAGSINISNILTGECLAKIKASDINHDDDCNSKQLLQTSTVRSTVAEALEDITALFYDEEHNEVYTGNGSGLVHVWSN